MPNTEFSVLGFAIMGIVAVATAIYTYYNEPSAHRPNEQGGRGGWYNDDGNDRPDGGRGRWHDDGNAGFGGERTQRYCRSSGNEKSRTVRGNTFDGEYPGSHAYGVSERNIEADRSRGNKNSRSRKQHSRTITAGTSSRGECDTGTNCIRNRKKFEDICAICQESLTDRNVTTSLCGHKFHYNCLYEWNTKGQNNCPVCRSPTVCKPPTY